jgi:hypothetical protein
MAPSSRGRGGARQKRRVLRRRAVGGVHLPCRRRGPAWRAARGVLAASSRRRGWPHPGAAPLLIHGGNRLRGSCPGPASLGLTGCPAPGWPWPTGTPRTPGPWPPPLAWRASPGPGAVGSVCPACVGPSRGSPGGCWGVSPGAGVEGDSPAPEGATPKRLPPEPCGPGGGRPWGAPPAGVVPPAQLRRGAAPRMAGARWGDRRGCGPRVLPPWCPPRAMGPHAGRGGPR